MRTRRSLSNLETVAKADNSDTPSKRKSLSKISKTPTSSKKEVNAINTATNTPVNLDKIGNPGISLNPSVYSSPIVRVLRSRVVTSDTEDEVKSCRTPKRRLSRGGAKEEKPLDTGKNETPSKVEANKSPESGRKKSTRQSLFSIVETEENEESVQRSSIEGGKLARNLNSSKAKVSISNDGVDEDFGGFDDVNKLKSRVEETVSTPGSGKRRKSLISNKKETPGDKKETPKSAGKRLSFENSFRVTETAVKTESPRKEIAREFDSKKSHVVTSDNVGRDEESIDTSENNETNDRVSKEKNTEEEYEGNKRDGSNKDRTPSTRRRSSIVVDHNVSIDTNGSKQSYGNLIEENRTETREHWKKIDITPLSAKTRSSLKVESDETPSSARSKKGVTPKSSEKRLSFKGSFKVDDMDGTQEIVNTSQNRTLTDEADKDSSSSGVSEPVSEECSVNETDRVENVGISCDSNKENVIKDCEIEEKSSESCSVDPETKSVSEKSFKTPVSSSKRSSVIAVKEDRESPVKEKTPKSSQKRSSLLKLLKIVEMEGAEDPRSGDSSLKTGDSADPNGSSSDTNEKSVNKDNIIEEKSSEMENIDDKKNSEIKELTKTPVSSTKRSSVIALNEERESPVKEKTPKSSQKRSSLLSSFKIVEIEEAGDPKSEESSVKTGDTADADGSSSDTNEENMNEDNAKEEKSTEIECVDAKNKSDSKKLTKTPVSSSKRSSVIAVKEDRESPVKEKTPKSSQKRSSLLSSFKIVEMEGVEDPRSEESSVKSGDSADPDGSSSDTNEEYVNKDNVIEEKSLEIENIDDKKESEIKKLVKTPKSASKGSFLISEKEERKSPLKGKTPKSSQKRSSLLKSFKIVEMEEVGDLKSGDSSVKSGDSAGSSSDKNEESVNKDNFIKDKSLEIENIDGKNKFESKKLTKTPVSASKGSFVITENEERKSPLKRKTPKSAQKRSSLLSSFKIVEMEENGDSDSKRDHHASFYKGSVKKDFQNVAKETEDETADKNASSVSKSPDSSDSEEFDLKKAMVMTSLAIRGEKRKSLKTPEKQEKMLVNEDESSKDSEEDEKEVNKKRRSKVHSPDSSDSEESVLEKPINKKSLANKEEKRKTMKIPEKQVFANEEESSESSEEHESGEVCETKVMIEEDGSESSSDDEVPESMSFDSGKQQMNNAVKMAMDAVRREKERIKEQKRKRMEMIVTQKKEKEQRKMEKLKMLENKMPKRLREDIVNQLPDVPEIPTIKGTPAKKKKIKDLSEKKDIQKVKTKKNKIVKFDDYIPLDVEKAATKFGVVPLDVMERIPKSASEKALEFKKQALFGSRIRREPSKNLLLYKQKIGSAFKSKEANDKQRFKPY